MSKIIDIADAVVTTLNDGDFKPTFTAVRYYVPEFELEDLATLHVSVVPKALETESYDRTNNEWNCQIDIGVQQIITNDADCDVLSTFVEDIILTFINKQLTSYQSAFCVKVENNPVFSTQHLIEKDVFTSLITLTFKVIA
jgi:hypothetical protein